MKVLVKLFWVATIFLGLMLELVASATSTVGYHTVLKNLGLTFPGTYTPYADTDVIRCGVQCKSINCAGFAWDEATRECRIYSSLYVYTLPTQTTVTSLKTYLPEDSPIIFIKVIPNGRTWSSGKSECENIGGKMIYVPQALYTEGMRLFDAHGPYLLGLHKTSSDTATWSTLYGEELELNQIYWDAGQPDLSTMHSYPNCGAWWSRPGVHDCGCNHNDGRIAICDMNAVWRD